MKVVLGKGRLSLVPGRVEGRESDGLGRAARDEGGSWKGATRERERKKR